MSSTGGNADNRSAFLRRTQILHPTWNVEMSVQFSGLFNLLRSLYDHSTPVLTKLEKVLHDRERVYFLAR